MSNLILEILEQRFVTKQPKGMRNIMAFPRIQDFYNTLMSEIHLMLEQQFLDLPFTILVNALPRDHEAGTLKNEPRFENVPLNYAGIDSQRTILEKEIKKSQRIQKRLDVEWKKLKSDSNEEGWEVSSSLYNSFARGNFKLKDIPYNRMVNYFEPITNKQSTKKPNSAQFYEYKILKVYGFIKNYFYLSVPLIQFGEFDGVVHIILHQDDMKDMLQPYRKTKRLNTKRVGRLIKVISRIYEGLILSWDTKNAYEYRASVVKSMIVAAQDPNLYKRLGSNSILKELKYQEYYKKYAGYLLGRVETSGELPLVVKDQYRRIAIMSILIDSFAHNISAHSLTALEWSIKQRAELLRKIESPNSDREKEKEKLAQLPLLSDPGHLDSEVHPLLRFLLDKGAFWNGLTRVVNFGGKVSSLYSVLWYNFINNPLYLGTIAFSEGINKLNFRITVLDSGEREASIYFKKKVLLDGEFASIDLSGVYLQPDSEVEEEDRMSKYVTYGKDYKAIKNKLQKFRAFFPGGVVGQHAFFTILENEIRNVKHFGPEAIKHMEEHGLTLNISIEEGAYDHSPDDTKYYKMGVWINHPVAIDEKLINVRLEKLWGDIIEEKTNNPRLGGIFQDKVCAAMLYNNSFSSVQDLSSERSRHYYPYVKVGSCMQMQYNEGDILHEYEISARRFFDPNQNKVSRRFFKTHFQKGLGHYKKFFHLWKGEDIHSIKTKEEINYEWENLARFTFIHVPPRLDINSFTKLRQLGIIRIVDKTAKSVEEAYRIWLNKWLQSKQKPQYKILFKVDGQASSLLQFDGKKFAYLNYQQAGDQLEAKSLHEISLVHGGKEEEAKKELTRFRKHGIFQRHFCNGQRPHRANMSPQLAAELFEVLNTKVCVFDNRIAHRLKEGNISNYKEALGCVILEEKIDHWQVVKQAGFDQFHFLVIHLSFIESFKDKNGERYSEEDISGFIQEQVLDGKEAPENFVVVITTGRGRTQWWEKLKTRDEGEDQQSKKNKNLPLTAFVTFRPVESLIAAVENSLSMKDDLELKYRLVKVLFGS